MVLLIRRSEDKVCKEKCEVYSRVVGFYRPVLYWNKGKKEEFKMRKTFKMKKSLESLENKKKLNETPLKAEDNFKYYLLWAILQQNETYVLNQEEKDFFHEFLDKI